jgi:Transposase IS116/IS110/IS902 family
MSDTISNIETWKELETQMAVLGISFDELVDAVQAQDYIESREDLPLRLARRDLKDAAQTMSVQQARYTVDMYYQVQHYRIQSDAQRNAAMKLDEPHEVLAFTALEMRKLEDDLKVALGAYADSNPLGVWARSICGIGPVISAGLLAHIDIERAPTVGHIWAFAGFDPTKVWGKGEKRPWNAKLKTLCAYKLGESFVKVQNRPADIYGQVFRARKDIEEMRNAQGLFADQAEAALSQKKVFKGHRRLQSVYRRSFATGTNP